MELRLSLTFEFANQTTATDLPLLFLASRIFYRKTERAAQVQRVGGVFARKCAQANSLETEMLIALPKYKAKFGKTSRIILLFFEKAQKSIEKLIFQKKYCKSYDPFYRATLYGRYAGVPIL